MSCYIEKLHKRIAELEKGLERVRSTFYCIGGPLNDNVLNFNAKQRKWCHNLVGHIENCLSKPTEE
jgi:hypothetical protein